MNDELSVWVFNGTNRDFGFPAGVFLELEIAEEWIRKHSLSGTLTRYPVNTGVYEWAIEKGYFRPKRENQTTPDFIARFSSGAQEHYHYENGLLPGSSVDR
jgi:hypothetical protein